MPERQLEPSTRLICRQCGAAFQVKNRNGVKKEFCGPQCRTAWHNAQRLKGAALLKAKKPAVQRPRKSSIRGLDQLAAAQGLPAGSYPAGALGRIGLRSVAAIIPAAERIALLLEAAKRLGITEGETLKAARRAQRLAGHEGEAA